MEEAEPEWERQQRETFLKWVQNKLKKNPEAKNVESLDDLTDGVALCQLIELMFPESQIPRFNKNPKLAPHKLDNVNIVLKFLESQDIKVVVRSQSIVEGNHTFILGLLWTLILELDINRAMNAAAAASKINEGKDQFKFKPGKAKDRMLEWVNSHVEKYGLHADNFDKDFADGQVLLALNHSLRPDTFAWPSDRSNAKKNVEMALEYGDRNMGVAPILNAEDLASGNMDEKSVMTYSVGYLIYEQENEQLVRKVAEEHHSKAALLPPTIVTREKEEKKEQTTLVRKVEESESKSVVRKEESASNTVVLKQAPEAQTASLSQANMAKRQQASIESAGGKAGTARLLVDDTKFMSSLRKREAREYVLFIDKSGSMAGSRWEDARLAMEALTPQIMRASPNGFSMYFFNKDCVRIDGIKTPEHITGFFKREFPDWGTNLLLPLQHAFDLHFSKNPRKLETWLIITDGAPDQPTRILQYLKEVETKFKTPSEVTVSFVQIGASDDAQAYLSKLKGTLSFVDTVTQDELPKQSFATLFNMKK